MKITVTKKNQYGNDRFFPQDDTGKFIAAFGKRETFTQEHLDMLQSLGFTIEHTREA